MTWTPLTLPPLVGDGADFQLEPHMAAYAQQHRQRTGCRRPNSMTWMCVTQTLACCPGTLRPSLPNEATLPLFLCELLAEVRKTNPLATKVDLAGIAEAKWVRLVLELAAEIDCLLGIQSCATHAVPESRMITAASLFKGSATPEVDMRPSLQAAGYGTNLDSKSASAGGP